MDRIWLPLLAAALVGAPGAAAPAEKVVRPAEDATALLRNPAMGWVLYLDAVRKYPDADAWWRGLAPYAPYASIFYHRARWSDYEPEEGRYAWLYDANFRKMLQQARDRGLKLAFRVLVNSRDNEGQATPEYVRRAGAQGYLEPGQGGKEYWCPNLDDPVFQQKFARFLEAFGKAFDDPEVVDFVDGNGLGWWGEAHHLHLAPEKREPVYTWICSAYAKAFRHVLLAGNLSTEFGRDLDERIAYRQFGYVARRDGLGSHWFGSAEKEFLLGHFPQLPLIGESCYSSVKSWTDPWKGEPGMREYRDVLAWSVKDALDTHSNTLDLRNPNDAKTWVEDAPELVQRFIREGGYRLSPVEVRFPAAFTAGRPATLRHSWRNTGVGVLPNANPRWGRKYQVAFALLKEGSDQPAAVQVDAAAEPSRWIRGATPSYETAVTWRVPAGAYRLAVAIVDTTRGSVPAIQLAVKDLPRAGGWYVLGEVSVGAG